MDAKDHPIISVLSDQKRFMIPIYQRQYSWGQKFWTDFWDDLVAKAEETLEGKPKFKHYMGALIIAPGSDGYTVGTTPRVQVVDGQQRLTTFQLFLAGLREVATRMNFVDIAESVQNYVFNRPMTGDRDPDAKFKLVPTPEDRKVFHDIMDGDWQSVRTTYPNAFFKNGKLRSAIAPATIRGLAFFIDNIASYARFGLYDPEEERPSEDDESLRSPRLQALLEALLNHLKLVVITLDENDDAQVIFETLNSKAEPLLAMDLVRNNIFHRAEAQGESSQQLFDTKWRLLQGQFWKSDSPRAKPRRPRIDHFLSHALTAQTGKEASLRELYAEYRAFTRPRGKSRFPTVEEELDALLQFVPPYEALERGGSDSSIARLGTKLAVWEVATAYPLIFNIATAGIDDVEKEVLFRLIYSYLVRRAVCGLNAKNHNKTFQRIVGVFLNEGVSRNAFVSAFAGQTGPAVRFPSDEEFSVAIRTNPVYQWILKKDRLTDILWELELKVRDKFSVGTPRPSGMSIEHILPQTWMQNWPLPDGRKAPPDRVTNADERMLSLIAERQALLHTLGNLTLITVPGNSAASHSAFTQKKTWLKKSLLALNLEITDDRNAVWDEAAILNRSDALSKLALDIWPAIDSRVAKGM